MYLPEIKFSKKSQPVIINQFGGLNRTESISDAEFSDMKNCGGRRFPHVCSREKRKILKSVTGKIKAVAPLVYGGERVDGDDFVGVVDNEFIYRDTSKGEVSDRLTFPYPYSDPDVWPQFGGREYPITILPFNGCYCIFPSFKIFDPVKGTMGNICKSFTRYVKFRNKVASGTTDYSTGNFIEPYSKNKNYSDYVYKGNLFKKGDRITIYYDASSADCNNCTHDSLSPLFREELFKGSVSSTYKIVSAFVDSVTMDTTGTYVRSLDVVLHNVVGNASTGTAKSAYFNYGEGYGYDTSFEPDVPVTISKYMPPIVYACVSGGRIWGLDPYGSQIMCCAAGDASEWTNYDGSATAPWFTEVSSYGEWTAIAEFGGNVYCFKRDVCHVIYGDNSTNFSLAKTINYGCIDSRSVKVVGNALYFLGSDGFYVCSGSQAVKISEKLGRTYTGCVAGCDGSLYYASCYYDGGCELLVYDTEKNIWWREDETKAVGFFNYEDKLYCATDGEFFVFGEGELADEWSVVSKNYDDGTSKLRSLCSLLFRLKLPAGSDATIYICYDGGEWIKCGHVENGKLTFGGDGSPIDIDGFDEDAVHKADSAYYQKVPARFRASSSYKWKLVCHGDAVLEAVERSVTLNGKMQR